MAAAVNLVTNPSFGTNLTGWSFANGSGAQDTVPNSILATGQPYSCKVTSSGGVTSASYTVSGLTIGRNYTFSFYVKISSATADFSLAPSINGNVSLINTNLATGDDFVRRYAGFTATATTATVSIISQTSLVNGDIFWIDNVLVNKGSLIPYFDGNYPYSAWTGTANASTSTNTAFDDTLVIPNSDTTVVINGLCFNTLAWMPSSKTGRFTVSPGRGDDITVPGVNGRTFVPNKPIDTGLWTLPMIILGCRPDGSVPFSSAQNSLMRDNFNLLLRQCFSTSQTVSIYVWTPNGSVVTTQATLIGNSPDGTSMMGGRRLEVSLVFEVLSGIWQDALSTTVTGTAGTGWSYGTLTLTSLRNGTAAIDDAIVTVTGPITNPVLSNPYTNTSVTFTGTVPAGQTWVMNSGTWSSVVNGSSVLTSTTHLGHPRFLVIDPGNLSTAPVVVLSGSATSSATNISIIANRKHLLS